MGHHAGIAVLGQLAAEQKLVGNLPIIEWRDQLHFAKRPDRDMGYQYCP
jgi:hypothetical protein